MNKHFYLYAAEAAEDLVLLTGMSQAALFLARNRCHLSTDPIIPFQLDDDGESYYLSADIADFVEQFTKGEVAMKVAMDALWRRHCDRLAEDDALDMEWEQLIAALESNSGDDAPYHATHVSPAAMINRITQGAA